MKRIALTLISVAALALGACDGTSDQLTGGPGSRDPRDPNSTAGGEDTTFDHNNDPGGTSENTNPPAEPSQIKMVGSPEVTSRLHACGKLTVSSLGSILNSRGLVGVQGAQRPQGAQTGLAIYNQGASAAALGGPNYNGRVPEAPFASTSAMAKMFDIFTMASYDAVAANWTATACPDVKVLGADGKFTQDGLTCLMGKPAKPEHVAIANDAIAKNATDGAKIAIAAVLSAAHTCQ
ncbi:MAG: hypothetical protein KF819_19720 [Labilithrix sp.]|nr:hypothetical protein [Labilithrix sp.]